MYLVMIPALASGRLSRISYVPHNCPTGWELACSVCVSAWRVLPGRFQHTNQATSNLLTHTPIINNCILWKRFLTCNSFAFSFVDSNHLQDYLGRHLIFGPLQWVPAWLPWGSDGKASACNAGELGLIPGSERFPGEGNSNPLQYSCLENPIDRGDPMVHGVAESDTTEQLNFPFLSMR